MRLLRASQPLWNAGADKSSELAGNVHMSFEAEGSDLGSGPGVSEITEGLSRLPKGIFDSHGRVGNEGNFVYSPT